MQKPDVVFTGNIEYTTAVFTWVYEHCIPLVREITFDNGEEMTEEGLPLLILFYHPEETSMKDLFKKRVVKYLRGELVGGGVLYVLILLLWLSGYSCALGVYWLLC